MKKLLGIVVLCLLLSHNSFAKTINIDNKILLNVPENFNYIKIEADKEIELFFISGGFIEVINDKVSILATEVISSNDINISECADKIKQCNDELEVSENELILDMLF